MKVWRTIAEVERGGGFVPTMGALHAGHLSLMETARRENDRVAISIFVNPLQFAPHEDLSRYPRPLERDLELAERAGADVAFVPSVVEMYPVEPTRILVPKVTDLWEGASRPGHFEGVATVVAKLFGIMGPERAYFGRKDLQQCAVIAKMVGDLSMPVTLRVCPTVRESDGLAMSSRNVYLSPEERAVAPRLFATISESANRISAGESVEDARHWAFSELESYGFHPDYVAAVSDIDLSIIEERQPNSSVIVAAKLGSTRLIDNVPIPERVSSSTARVSR